MKAKERLDKIAVSTRERMEEEVSALLGKNLKLAEAVTRVVTKEEYFSEPAGKSVLAHIQIEGELEGQGCLLVGIKDAIRIGGTLIMLPDSELETFIGEDNYTEELEDSYGEIANILCGSLTSTYEEQHKKDFRLVRTEQEVILPAKVDIESDTPIPDESYYVMTHSMQLVDQEIGNMDILLPAVPFELVAEETPAAAAEEPAPPETASQGTTPDAPSQQEEVATIKAPPQDESPESVGTITQPVASAEETASSSPSVSSRADVIKQQKNIDGLLTNAMVLLGEEVGSLLGGALSLTSTEPKLHNKESLLDHLGGKQVMARLDVRGEQEGEAFLFAGIKDAVYLGGALIMLPDSELEETVRNEEFGEDANDAYGEIANIIAGVYTNIFEEQSRKNLGFVKTELEVVIPVKVDPDTDETVPNQLYYLSSGTMKYNDRELGTLQFATPAELFGLEALAEPEKVDEPAGESSAAGTSEQTAAGTSEQTAAGAGVAEPSVLRQEEEGAADILIFTDHEEASTNISETLQQLGYVPKVLHFKDSVNTHLTGSIRLIFLVMEEVSEQGFGVAIKISSAGKSIPLVAAGPAWTRTLVLKAVKYGASDILITPPGESDVREKVEMNLAKQAA